MIYLVIPTRMLHGSVLYRDIFCSYGPGSFDLFAGLFRVFGSSITLERVVGPVTTCHSRSPVIASGRGLATIALVPLDLTVYASVGAAGFVLWSIAYLRGDRLGFVIGGLLGALAVRWRPDIAPMVVLCWALLLRHTLWPWAAAGLAVGPLPMVATAFTSPMGVVVHDGFLGRVRAAGQNRLSIPPRLGDDRVLLVLVAASAAICLVLAIVQRRDWLVWSMTGVAVLTLPQALQCADWAHPLFGVAVAAALAVAVIVDGWDVAQRGGAVVGLAAAVSAQVPGLPAVVQIVDGRNAVTTASPVRVVSGGMDY